MAVIYTRGRVLKTTITRLFVVAAAAAVLTVLVQLVIAATGGSPPDSGWAVLAVLSTAVAVGSARSQRLLRLLSVADPQAHRGRSRAVWGLVVLAVLLVVALKIGSPDQDAYKALVFGEGGLVEWSQVVVLVLATRVAWLISSDLNARLETRLPGRLFQLGSGCLALVLMEELAWGQVIFSWRTPPLLREINAQNETTLHNIGWFQERLVWAPSLRPLGFWLLWFWRRAGWERSQNTVLNRWRPWFGPSLPLSTAGRCFWRFLHWRSALRRAPFPS